MPTHRLPVVFYDDHQGRGLPSGREISRNSRGVLVELDGAALHDIIDDAAFYVAMGVAEFGPEYRGLIASARATLRRLTDNRSHR